MSYDLVMRACVHYLGIVFLFTMKFLSAESKGGDKWRMGDTLKIWQNYSKRTVVFFFNFLSVWSAFEIHSLDFKFRSVCITIFFTILLRWVGLGMLEVGFTLSSIKILPTVKSVKKKRDEKIEAVLRKW